MEEELNHAMEVFKQHLRPASSQEDADTTMTTAEIFDAFKEFLQDDSLDIDKFFKLLKEHGYTYDWVVDGFKWLLKTS